MVTIASWLTVLNLFISIYALPCEFGPGSRDDGTCSADSALVSLRQLVVQRQRGQGAEQLDVGAVGKESSRLSPACGGGRLLPEIYLLGAPKCGTTELAGDMTISGIAPVPTLSTIGPLAPGFDKEFHYFLRSYREGNSYHSDSDVERSGEIWFESMPACNESVTAAGQRMITADYTPTQLALAPPGDGYRIVRTLFPSDQGVVDIDLPHTLQTIYSHYMGASINRVRFIVNFREPLARMQSHWYHMYQTSALSVPFLLAANFSEEVRLAVDGYLQGQLSMVLWYSLYGRQVKQYLAAFTPSQFFFLPFLYFINLAKTEVCDELSHFLDYPVTCRPPRPANESSTSMHFEHPSVEADVAPDLIARFQHTIAGENELLVQQLIMAHQQGATLAQFAGSPSVSAIKEWLTAGW